MTTIRRWRWPIIGLTVLAAFALACQGDETGTGTGGTNAKSCDMREAQPPTFIIGPGKGLIEAKVHAVCDVPPRQHVLRLWLEKEASDGKTYLQVGQTAEWRKVTDFPPATGRDYAIQVQCVPGYWRLRATADGISSDGVPFHFGLSLNEIHIAYIPRCAR